MLAPKAARRQTFPNRQLYTVNRQIKHPPTPTPTPTPPYTTFSTSNNGPRRRRPQRRQPVLETPPLHSHPNLSFLHCEKRLKLTPAPHPPAAAALTSNGKTCKATSTAKTTSATPSWLVRLPLPHPPLTLTISPLPLPPSSLHSPTQRQTPATTHPQDTDTPTQTNPPNHSCRPLAKKPRPLLVRQIRLHPVGRRQRSAAASG